MGTFSRFFFSILCQWFAKTVYIDRNLPKDVDSFKSTTVRRFYERTKKEGVLWLNAELTTNISGSTPTTISPFWYPIILKIFKMIFQSRLEHKDDRGVVVALFGDGFSELQTAVRIPQVFDCQSYFFLFFYCINSGWFSDIVILFQSLKQVPNSNFEDK
jgi:hypothetical protein